MCCSPHCVTARCTSLRQICGHVARGVRREPQHHIAQHTRNTQHSPTGQHLRQHRASESGRCLFELRARCLFDSLCCVARYSPAWCRAHVLTDPTANSAVPAATRKAECPLPDDALLLCVTPDKGRLDIVELSRRAMTAVLPLHGESLVTACAPPALQPCARAVRRLRPPKARCSAAARAAPRRIDQPAPIQRGSAAGARCVQRLRSECVVSVVSEQ